MTDNASDEQRMRNVTDRGLHNLIRKKALLRDEHVADGEHWQAEQVNDFACRMADELARRNAERREWEGFELALVGIVGVAEAC